MFIIAKNKTKAPRSGAIYARRVVSEDVSKFYPPPKILTRYINVKKTPKKL